MKKNKSLWLIVLAALAALLIMQAVQTRRFNQKVQAFPDESVIGQGKPVLLQISSAGCIHCRLMLPTLTELADRYAEHFTVALVSLDKQPDAQQKYGVQAIPMQIFLDGQGTELFRHTGKLSKEEILDRWSQLGVEIP
jgi:thioredoxin-like negative regulator of GroEL